MGEMRPSSKKTRCWGRDSELTFVEKNVNEKTRGHALTFVRLVPVLASLVLKKPGAGEDAPN